jgi:GT2 family glycosyltransferase
VRKVDIIIPVYNGLDLVRNCIQSILADTCSTPSELIVIDDASPDPAVWRYLEKQATAGRITLLRNEENLGFTGTVNRGMRLHPDRDVLLLNSDTIVYRDWLDRLRLAAYSDSSVASSNPMTGAGGSHVSYYPYAAPIESHRIEVSDEEIDAIAAECNVGVYAYAHAIVGFCMFIKRAALDDVGYFDIENFPVGYGEETDFCFRAYKLGWRHIVTGDTFVTHLEGKSFGEKKQRLMEDMFGRFQRLHPEAVERDRNFVAADPVRPLRANIDLGRLKRVMGGRRTLPVFVVDDVIRGGGCDADVSLRFDKSKREFCFLIRAAEAFPNLPTYRIPQELDLLNYALDELGVDRLWPATDLERDIIVEAVSGLPIEHGLSAALIRDKPVYL